MKKVTISDLEPGAVLAEDAKDATGRKLVGAGMALTERHLRAFRIWDVREVVIVSDDAEPDAPPDPLSQMTDDLWQTARTRTEARFALVDRTHPVLAALFEIGLRQTAFALVREVAGDN
jgi:hypothetical protein